MGWNTADPRTAADLRFDPVSYCNADDMGGTYLIGKLLMAAVAAPCIAAVLLWLLERLGWQ